MTETTRTQIVTEVREELGLATSVPSTLLEQYIKEGEARLNNLVKDKPFDFEVDLVSRALLKNYVRYAYWGALDEFNIRYRGDLYDAQIRNL